MSSTTFTQGMVTSPDSVASECGAAVLRQGGTAVEAAIATCAALFVTYPHFCGMGGDILMLTADSKGKVQAVTGIGQSAVDIRGYEQHIPVRGGRSALTSAGALCALEAAWNISKLDMGGRYSWKSLWEPALSLAAEGYPVSASERFWLSFRDKEKKQLPAIFQTFSPHGVIPDVGTLRRRTDLSASIRAIADQGAREFYEGELANKLVKGLIEIGSPLRLGDLAATRAKIETPLSLPYRGGILLSQPPPTQGMTTLQIMGLLEQFDFQKITQGSADHFHLMVEAVKLAFQDRNLFLADPDYSEIPIDRLLSKKYLIKQASSIHMHQAAPWPHAYQQGDTVYIGAYDAKGNAASVLATIYFDWGSGVMVGDTGVLWHNRGSAFTTAPSHPNSLAPSKRPFHTLNPGLYMKNNKPNILFGTQGADGQPQTLAAVLTRLIDFGMDPLSALAAPRFLLGKTFSDSSDNLKLESNVGSEVIHNLKQRGHYLSMLNPQSPLMGHPGVIVIDPVTNLISGAHDPRSDGLAIGI